MKFMPRTGSPPMPTQVLWPKPLQRGLIHGFVRQRAGARHDADRPGLWMKPGMMPILHSPGVMMPGQFGPMSRVAVPCERGLHAAPCRCTGTPSVMQTTSSMPASAASRIASAANGAGT